MAQIDKLTSKVLSIDAQRLELADVLATSGNQDPATQTVSTEEPDDDRHILSWRGLLASRMFNSGTLVLVRFLLRALCAATNVRLWFVSVSYTI